MKNKMYLILLMLCISCLLFACNQNETTTIDTITIKDVLDREVTIQTNPQRFVCIGPNALRLYTYIADITKIVGIENFEIVQTPKGRPYIELYQSFIDELPIVSEGGPKATPNSENILLANPDVIIMSGYYDRNTIDTIANTTQIPTIVITNDTSEGTLFSEDLMKSLEIIGSITGYEERATEVINYLNAVKEDLTSRTNDITTTKTAYIGSLSKSGHQQITSTSGDYEIFDLVNITNISKLNNIQSHAIIDKETLLTWNPETIFMDANGYQLYLADKAVYTDYYGSLQAFQNHQVYLQMPYNFYSTNLEVALANAYHVGKIMYPEQFADIDLTLMINQISQSFLHIDISEILIEDFYGGYQIVN